MSGARGAGASRALALALSASLAWAGHIGAQGVTPRPPGGDTRPCDQRLVLVGITIVDSRGAPVQDAKLSVRNERTRRDVLVLDHAAPGSPGFYPLFDDGAMSHLDRAGEWYVVTARRGRSTARARIRIGLDRAGCHVARLAGPDKLTLG